MFTEFHVLTGKLHMRMRSCTECLGNAAEATASRSLPYAKSTYMHVCVVCD